MESSNPDHRSIPTADPTYPPAFEQALNPLFILDETGRCLEANASALRFLECGIEDIRGNKIPQTEPFVPFLAPQTLEIDCCLNGAVKTLLLNVFPIALPRRKVLFAIGQDITKRKRLEEIISRAKQEWEKTFDSVTDLMFLLNPDYTIRRLNRALAIKLGVKPGELVGRRCYEAIHHSDAPADFCPFARLLRDGKQHAAEVYMKELSGWFTITASPYGNGMPSGAVMVVRDITERRNAEEERLKLERLLLRSQKSDSLGELAGGIAHDFNNLLLAVLGNLDLALNDISPGSSARSNIMEAVKAARRAADLTFQMLLYSGKGSISRIKLHLSELVQENEAILRAAVPRTIKLTMKLQLGLPAVTADKNQTMQMLMNLLINAAEAIGDRPGEVTVSVGDGYFDRQYLSSSRLPEKLEPGRYVYLRVSDTGCGMDRETMDRIFDPFFTKKFIGRGLGMSAVIGIVKGHEGAIMVESEPAKGSTIEVLFPILQQGRRGDSKGTAYPTQNQDKPDPGTILVVDDEDMVRKMCAAMISRLGYKVLSAGDGIEAVELYKEHGRDIACVILDLTMPRMNGTATLRALRSLNPDVKIVLSSGYTEQQAVFALGEKEAAFLQKPYDLNTLQSVLRNYLKAS